MMAEYREMPYEEKLAGLLSYMKMVEDFAPHLVKNELGEERLLELQKLWKQGTESIPTEASIKDRYEIVYKNFLLKWVTANKFMDKYQGEFGTAKYMQAAILAWKKKYAREAFALKTVGGISRKTAFEILAKRFAYQLQAFSPFKVAELSKNRMVLDVTPCKIIMDQNGNDFCIMACRNIIPSWLETEFNIKMNSTRQGTNCSVIFEPFNS
jgi:hypothetical protein